MEGGAGAGVGAQEVVGKSLPAVEASEAVSASLSASPTRKRLRQGLRQG